MPRRSRLDAELVRRGLARSREHAVALIAEGRVAVAGRAATKPATGVEASTPVVVRTDPDTPTWVSRGAHKLLGALDAFAVPVEVADMPRADVRLTMTSDDLIAMTEGRLSFPKAMMTGKVKVEAPLKDMFRLRSAF